MNSVCLLHSVDAPFEAQRSANQLAQALRSDHHVLLRTIGRGGSWSNALAAARALRRSPQALIHAFDVRSLVAAAMSARQTIAFTASADRLSRAVRIVRAIGEVVDVQVICPTATIHRLMVERGLPLERCHLIRPGVDFSRLQRRRDPDLRARLGLGMDDIVILAPGESTQAAAHDLAAWAVSMLRVSNQRFRLLLWGRGESVHRALRFGRKLQDERFIISAESALGRPVELEEILPAADLVLATARDAVPTLPIATCMAASLPIVATATYTHSELLEDRHNALLVAEPRARDLARRVLHLLDDADLQWRLADMARVEAYEYFALTRFVEQHRTLYGQLTAGQPVNLETSATGAGLRFHGRG